MSKIKHVDLNTPPASALARDRRRQRLRGASAADGVII
jgi:hypothetical protein